ncbi:MAG: hypothetical protein R8P61_28645 [Bacteroidia bacterium]|nr:hypothetical protein [Bacteroidia bacterium]
MVDTKQLKEKYIGFSNKELIRIVRNRTDYTTQAIEAIQEILEERALETEEIDLILDEIIAEDKVEQALEEESLNYWEKLLLVSIPIIGFILYLIFRLRNKEVKYSKRIAKSLTYSLLGTIIFAVFIIVWMNQ